MIAAFAGKSFDLNQQENAAAGRKTALEYEPGPPAMIGNR